MSLHASQIDQAAAPADSARFEAFSAPAAQERRQGEARVCMTPRYGEGEREVRVHWRLEGAAGAPVIIVQGGISADRNALPSATHQGWWRGFAGAGCAIDTARWRVLGIDWLSRRDLGAARAIDTADQASAIAGVLGALGIAQVHAFIGASYGAMVGLAFAARFPARLARLCAIAGAHRAHPLSVALRNIQRDIVRLGARSGDGLGGLALARRLAMTTYRSDREFAERCSDAPVYADGRFQFAEEPWLRAAGDHFAARFDAQRYLALSESIDLHAVEPERIGVPVTLVGISSDRVVPLADICELQRRCGSSATLHVIDSLFGHDGFLKEDAQIGAIVSEILESRGGVQ